MSKNGLKESFIKKGGRNPPPPEGAEPPPPPPAQKKQTREELFKASRPWELDNYSVIDMGDGMWVVASNGRVIERDIPSKEEACQRAGTAWLRGRIEEDVPINLLLTAQSLVEKWITTELVGWYTLDRLTEDIRFAVTGCLKKELWDAVRNRVERYNERST